MPPCRPPGFVRPSLLALALAVGAHAPLRAEEAATTAPVATAAAAGASVPAAAPVPLPADGLDIEHGDRLQGLKKVAIAGLALYVISESEAGASAGAAGHGSMAVVNASMKVTGLEPARLQALADATLERTVQALRARGIEVMPEDELKALPAFAALQAQADASPLAVDAAAGKGSVYGAHGLPMIHMGEMGWLSRTVGGLFGAKVSDPYVSLGDQMSAGFRLGRLGPALDALGQAAGVPLVFVRVVLTAAQVKTSGGAFTLRASTDVRNSLLMPAWTNRILVRRVDGSFGRVSLKKPLISETGLGELVDVTSTGAKVADVATTVLTLAASMMGAGRAVSQRSQVLELRSSPEQFDAVAWPHVAGTLEGLAGALTP